MKKQSIWKEIKTKSCPPLTENIETDVLIIGGGITGMSILYHLKSSNFSVILVERNTCGHGVTSKSTAKITYLQDNTIMNIANFKTEETAQKYLESQIHATELLKDIITREQIDCDLEPASSYLFTNTKRGVKKLRELKEHLEAVGEVVCDCQHTPFAEPFTKALKVDDTYVFHPLKYVNFMKEKFSSHVYENTKVDKIIKEQDHYIVTANGHSIRAKRVVLANHYPYFLIPYLFPLKSHIEVSYLGARSVEQFAPYSAINIDKPTKSLRFHRGDESDYELQLLNSYTSCNVANIKSHFEELENIGTFDYVWSNNDIITGDYMPYIGPLDAKDKTFLIATGYNTWGMTNATLAGELIADILNDQENEYENLFSPTRLGLSKIIRYPIDLACSAKAYAISNKTNPNNKKVIYTKINGQSVAIYEDPNGVKHTVLNRCPHMKCGIVLNEVEGTWDCLCHGSRFDLDGKCLEGPSNYDISFDPESN